MARGATVGWVVCSLALTAVGCSCAEVWSVAEELGADLWADDVALEPRLHDARAAAEVLAIAPIAAPDPAPGPADRARAERFGSFIGELCMRMRRGNSTYVELHVDLPIEVRLRREDRTGGPAFDDLFFDNAYDLRMSGICADLTWLGAGIEVRPLGDNWLVTADGNGSAVELELRETAKGRLKMVRYRQL